VLPLHWKTALSRCLLSWAVFGASGESSNQAGNCVTLLGLVVGEAELLYLPGAVARTPC
jgi:hypothetical protein